MLFEKAERRYRKTLGLVYTRHTSRNTTKQRTWRTIGCDDLVACFVNAESHIIGGKRSSRDWRLCCHIKPAHRSFWFSVGATPVGRRLYGQW